METWSLALQVDSLLTEPLGKPEAKNSSKEKSGTPKLEPNPTWNKKIPCGLSCPRGSNLSMDLEHLYPHETPKTVTLRLYLKTDCRRRLPTTPCTFDMVPGKISIHSGTHIQGSGCLCRWEGSGSGRWMQRASVLCFKVLWRRKKKTSRHSKAKY